VSTVIHRSTPPSSSPAPALRRLNWGCGPKPVAGWINSDILIGSGIDVSADIRHGLPFEADSIRYISSIHALQDLPVLDLVPALCELRRILEPNGVLRLALPDLDRAIAAYLRGDPGYFYVPDSDAEKISGKLIVQMSWYGSSRSMFTFEFAEELLLKAGFRDMRRCRFHETTSEYPEIVELDNRERESLFIEATK